MPSHVIADHHRHAAAPAGCNQSVHVVERQARRFLDQRRSSSGQRRQSDLDMELRWNANADPIDVGVCKQLLMVSVPMGNMKALSDAVESRRVGVGHGSDPDIREGPKCRKMLFLGDRTAANEANSHDAAMFRRYRHAESTPCERRPRFGAASGAQTIEDLAVQISTSSFRRWATNHAHTPR